MSVLLFKWVLFDFFQIHRIRNKKYTLLKKNEKKYKNIWSCQKNIVILHAFSLSRLHGAGNGRVDS